eukprot:CAMPEP_0182418870 /NCGR_PEP_ID=MMETSP1167-20130531/3245_1 /TAXON_ID=2988 /ORGANISM="Mallomonas Sp, Strain CCMP3275" /LENGTH=778 /DNA_ID=CAMNT_0024593327 /DNA_START=198 /DNA_END=2530 /DNA_ORIENTATION=-
MSFFVISNGFMGLASRSAKFTTLKSYFGFVRSSSVVMSDRGWGRKEWSPPRGGGGGGRFSGGRDFRQGGRGGRGGRFSRPKQDPYAKLRFSQTVKIDPEYRTKIEDMPLSPSTLKVLKEKGFEKMTPVQSQSFSHVSSGEDVVARSRTGTGKTLAFGLPLIEKLVSDGSNSLRGGRDLPLVLILEPTRELAIQVADELGAVCKAHRMNVLAMYGGSSFGMQERALRSGVHILVATPGRALDHISRGTVDLGNVKHVVLDEGDTMLEMGFSKEVENIIANVKAPGKKSREAAMRTLEDGADDGGPFRFNDDHKAVAGKRDRGRDEEDIDEYEFDDELSDEEEAEDDETEDDEIPSSLDGRDVQVLLFSATMPGWICSMTEKHMVDPIFLDAVNEDENRLPATIEHIAIPLPNTNDRVQAVAAFAEDIILTKGDGGQTIVFTNTKDEANQLAASDCFGQLRTQVLHGDIGQNSRQATIKAFKTGTIEVLVATDVAARGLDIAGVNLVLHIAPPQDEDTYVHRSGRTGRAGRNGTSVVLYSGREARRLFEYERSLNFKFTKAGPPTPKEVMAACAQFASRRLRTVSPELVSYFSNYAKEMLDNYSDYKGESEEGEDGEQMGGAMSKGGSLVTGVESLEPMEELLARCLAAISNRDSITCRSILTGETDTMSIEVHATFKNGSVPTSIRDWQRVTAGVMKRVLNEEKELRFGKMSLARAAGQSLFFVVDMPLVQGNELLQAVREHGPTRLPQGVRLCQCDVLPSLLEDPDRYRERDRYGGGG